MLGAGAGLLGDKGMKPYVSAAMAGVTLPNLVAYSANKTTVRRYYHYIDSAQLLRRWTFETSKSRCCLVNCMSIEVVEVNGLA